MNFSTTADDFTTLKNGIDTHLEIIRHDETGYYNITKIANLINKITAENDVGRIPPTSDYRSKRIKDWLRTESSKELVRVCKRYVDFDEVVYELKSNTPKKYTGTYVHRYLYDQFLNWLDVEYAIKISMILDEIHSKANIRIIQERDNIMAELREFREETRIRREEDERRREEEDLQRRERDEEARIQREEDERRYEELQRRNEADELIKQQILRALATANANNDITQAKLDKADAKADTHRNISLDILSFTEKLVKKTNALNNALIDKSKLSTKNPRKKNLHHGFAISKKILDDGTIHHTCIGGQEKHVIRQSANHETERGREIIQGFTLMANPIDFRNNICSAGHEMISKVIKDENTRRIEEHATKKVELAEKIAKHKQTKEDVKASDDARHAEALHKWNNSERLRKQENEVVRVEINTYNDNLKETIRRNNLPLPRGSPLKRTFSTDPERRMYTAERILTTEAYRAKYGLTDVRPERDDYVSGAKLESIQRVITKLSNRMGRSPKLIDERDIPITFRPSVYTWKENPYVSYEAFLKVFDDILEMTQSTPVEFDPKDFEIEDINFDGLDDFSEEDIIREAAVFRTQEDSDDTSSEEL